MLNNLRVTQSQPVDILTSPSLFCSYTLNVDCIFASLLSLWTDFTTKIEDLFTSVTSDHSSQLRGTTICSGTCLLSLTKPRPASRDRATNASGTPHQASTLPTFIQSSTTLTGRSSSPWATHRRT